MREVVQRTSREALSHFTAEQWFRHWLKAKKEAKAGKTGERYEQIAGEFLESLDGRAKLNVAALTPADVLKFRKQRMSKGLAPSTISLDVTIIRGAFNPVIRSGMFQKIQRRSRSRRRLSPLNTKGS